MAKAADICRAETDEGLARRRGTRGEDRSKGLSALSVPALRGQFLPSGCGVFGVSAVRCASVPHSGHRSGVARRS